MGRQLIAVSLLLLCAACDAKLPEAETPAARLYAERCSTCHQVFAPGSLTYAMWEFQVDRKQDHLVRSGFGALTKTERATILAYLKRHSQGAKR
jgi:cytochrome c2